MNKNLKTLIVPVALLGILTLPSLAHADTNKTVNERQERQKDRIRDGERSGELTRHEAADLKEREARIRADERHDRHTGGDFSNSEKNRIQNRLDNLGHDISRQKDDRQNKPRSYGNNGHYSGGGYYSGGHYYPGSINDRQRWQQSQITRGRRTGVLTSTEAAALRAREARVRYLESRLRTSGNGLSSSERYRLQRELTDLRRDIYLQSTDSQYRPRR